MRRRRSKERSGKSKEDDLIDSFDPTLVHGYMESCLITPAANNNTQINSKVKKRRKKKLTGRTFDTGFCTWPRQGYVTRHPRRDDVSSLGTNTCFCPF